MVEELYDAEKIKKTFDNMGFNEWKRFEGSAYRRFTRDLHIREVKKYIKKDMEVLDLGCGPGRFSIEALKLGAKVTLADISSKQLSIAQRKIKKAMLEKNVRDYIQLDCTDMPEIKSNKFDFVLNIGAVISFVADKHEDAIWEIHRVLKPSGEVLTEGVSRYGVFREALAKGGLDMWKNPDENHFWSVIETGRQAWGKSWAMYMFTAEEFRNLFEKAGFEVLDLFSIPCVSYAHDNGVEEIIQSKKARENLYEVEERLRSKPGMIDAGQYIMLHGKKK